MKDLYREMKKRIRIVINLLGILEPNKKNPLPEDNSFEIIANLINGIMGSAKFEENGQYKEAIIQIADWIHGAFQKEYLKENESGSPNPLYAVKKGAEVLHSLFHRDLRRKLLSLEEHEICRNYRALIQNLPNPQKKNLNQEEVDGMIEHLLKSG